MRVPARIGLALFALSPVIVATALASIQIPRVSKTGLSRWKGGGFGMYSDPHPHSHRTVWVRGTTDGVERAVRIYPVDVRLADTRKQVPELDRELRDLRWDMRRLRNAPGLRQPHAHLHEALHRLVQGESNAAGLFPTEDLWVVVVENAITSDYARLEGRIVRERRLCFH